MKALVILELMLVMLFLFGCDNYTPEEIAAKPAVEANQTRLTVVSRQVYVDSRDYSRDILMLKDTVTGREYLAVMGAGVAETTIQSNGKSRHTREE